MGETLTEQHRVSDEGLRIVKLCYEGHGEILLGQNTRYEKGEEKNDPELAQIWASLADVFVMDAFGSAHRAHASTVGVPSILKAEGKPVALGFLCRRNRK